MASDAETCAGSTDFSDPIRNRRDLVRRVIAGAVAIAALTAFGTVLIYTYNKGREQSADAAPVVLKADGSPYKVRPEFPGGMAVPDRDKEVYEIIAAGPAEQQVERLMSGREEPMARPKPEPALFKQETTEPPPINSANQMSMAVRSNSTRKPVMEVKKLAITRAPSKATPPTPPAEVTQEETKVSPEGPGYRIQIASLRSKPAVEKAWERLLRQHQDLLSRLEMSVQRVDFGPRKGIYFRMQAGPINNRARARKLCSELASRKVGCFVVRR